MQGTGGDLKGPTTAEAGTTIVVEVQGDTPKVDVGIAGTGTRTSYPVGADKRVQVPVPAGAAGQVLIVAGAGTPPNGSLVILIVSTFRDPCNPN